MGSILVLLERAERLVSLMAKASTTPKPFAITVHIAAIVWFKEWNLARESGEYGKLDSLLASMTTHGWEQSGDGTIEVEPIPDDYKKRGMEDRQRQWDALKEAVKTDKNRATELEVFKEIYVEDEKLRPIQYIGDTGNRRSQIYFQAMYARAKENLPLTTDIPVVVRHFEDPLDRLSHQIRENTHKSEGFEEMSMADMLRAAKRLYNGGCKQVRLRHDFNDGNGQQLWAYLELDRLHPSLNLFKRMTSSPEDVTHIRPVTRNVKKLNLLILRSDKDALEKKNRDLKINGLETLQPATAKDIEDFLTEKKPDGNAKKIMDKDTINGLANQFPAVPVRAAFRAVMANNIEGITKYDNAAVGLNALDILIQDGDYPHAELLLNRIVQTPQSKRPDLFKELKEFLDSYFGELNDNGSSGGHMTVGSGSTPVKR